LHARESARGLDGRPLAVGDGSNKILKEPGAWSAPLTVDRLQLGIDRGCRGFQRMKAMAKHRTHCIEFSPFRSPPPQLCHGLAIATTFGCG
jgi:hypothetical protein